MLKIQEADNDNGINVTSTFDDSGKTFQELMEELLKQALSK